MAVKHDGVVGPDGTLTRKQAANILGMSDTEFALRLIWDSSFPKPVQGAFRAADVFAWMKAHRTGGGAFSCRAGRITGR